MIQRSVNVDIEPTPYELAEAFCEMNADQQATVLNCIADFCDEWDRPLQEQVQSIVDSRNFHSGANKVMKTFGEYAK